MNLLAHFNPNQTYLQILMQRLIYTNTESAWREIKENTTRWLLNLRHEIAVSGCELLQGSYLHKPTGTVKHYFSKDSNISSSLGLFAADKTGIFFFKLKCLFAKLFCLNFIPGYSLEGLMLKLKLQYFGHLL